MKKNNNNKINLKKVKKRRFVTLIEMMIVMFLIALITGVVAYNYTGLLEKGKAFATETGMQRLQNVLSIAIAEDPSADITQWQALVQRSPLVKDVRAIINDGWGVPYHVQVNDNHEIMIWSDKYNAYKSKH
jgi:general secretion pathway protein G